MESLEQFLASSSQKKRKSPTRRMTLVGITVFGLVILGIVAWFGYGYYQKQQFVSQVPTNIRQELTFPIYLPTDTEVSINSASISYSNSIFQYSASVKNVPVVVTQQSKTSDFDIAKFATSQTLIGAQQTTIPIGTLLSASLRDRPLHIIDTGDTIITITSTQTGPADTLKPITNSLQKL